MKIMKERKKSTSRQSEKVPMPGVLAAERSKNYVDERRLLFLAPLVQVAWSHGVVSTRERYLIFKAAREEGIDERSPLNETLHEWLIYQPSRRFFHDCLEKLGNTLREMTVHDRGEQRKKLLARCRNIAQVSGDEHFDFGDGISVEERRLLAEIAAAAGINSGQQSAADASAISRFGLKFKY